MEMSSLFEVSLTTYDFKGDANPNMKLLCHDEESFITLRYGTASFRIKKEAIKILYKAFIEV